MRIIILYLLLILVSPSAICEGKFQPYEIKPGAAYYSDEYSVQNGVSQLGEEKNFEEVYQFYNYYEAVFDTDERIVTFKAYLRGDLEFSESYFYDDGGNRAKKIVRDSEGTESVVNFEDELSE